MKKVLFSAIALAGLAAVIASPAQAAPSISGAAVNVAENGNSIQSLAGQVVYTEGTALVDMVVTPTYSGTANQADYALATLTIAPVTAPVASTTPTTIEAAIAGLITGAVPAAPAEPTLGAAIGFVNAFK